MARKQAKKGEKAARIATEQGVSPRSGTKPPEERQFGKPNGNPRNPGGWKKEDTARFKLEQMMKMTEEELRGLAESEETPLFERKLAGCICDGAWKEIESMINQVYGYPKTTGEVVVRDPKPLIDLTKRKKNGEE